MVVVPRSRRIPRMLKPASQPRSPREAIDKVVPTKRRCRQTLPVTLMRESPGAESECSAMGDFVHREGPIDSIAIQPRPSDASLVVWSLQTAAQLQHLRQTQQGFDLLEGHHLH